MLHRLLSKDLPRSRWLSLLLIGLVLALAFTPFLFPGVKALNVAAKVLIFIVLVASFDLLLGYTGIVSFAHTMFYGIGAYGIAIFTTRMGPTWEALAMGVGASLLFSFALAWIVGLFSLRVRAIFFAMITLAVASAFLTLASQLHEITGGEDGLTFKVPEILSPGYEFSEEPFLGVSLNGRLLCFYLLFLTAVVLFLSLLRIVNSPFGRVLQAIRENEFRAEAIGYRVVVFRTISSILSALFACMAGAMLALWLRYNGPDTSLSFEIMMDVLLIVVIGGMGTMYGAIVGACLFLFAQSYLQDLLRVASEATASVPMLSALLSPDRWLLWLGLLFVLSVYYFPTGVVGRLRMSAFNYPNILDARRGKTGKGIWLHGTPPNQFSRPPQATDGCVVLANPDLDHIIRTVEVRSTPVIIAPQLQWVTQHNVRSESKPFEDALFAWRNAKTGGDLNQVLAFYTPDFNSNGKTLQEWTPTLKTEIQKIQGHTLQLKDVSYLRWTDTNDTMVVTFGEVAEGTKTGWTKRQYWIRQGSQWKIFFEGTM